jgi:hypothetical protein
MLLRALEGGCLSDSQIGIDLKVYLIVALLLFGDNYLVL